MNHLFQNLTHKSIESLGSPTAFNLAFAAVGVWALLGPRLHYSQAWQLLVNTSTTVLTFILAFLLQAAQRRHARRMQLKLDELIRAYRMLNTRQRFIKLEEAPEEELRELEAAFKTLSESAQKRSGLTSQPPN